MSAVQTAPPPPPAAPICLYCEGKGMRLVFERHIEGWDDCDACRGTGTGGTIRGIPHDVD